MTDWRAVAVGALISLVATAAVAVWAWRENRRYRDEHGKDVPMRYRGRRRRPAGLRLRAAGLAELAQRASVESMRRLVAVRRWRRTEKRKGADHE